MSAVMKEKFTTRKEALAVVAGLSQPSKMPGWAYGLPARECRVGTKLRAVRGSVCSGCYAMKGQYRFDNVQEAQYRRLETIKDPRWVGAMIFLMHDMKIRWFRWHDSGDIQSPSHLEKLVTIAKACPKTKFWLPTREKIFVYTVLKKLGEFPKNLIVRMSAAMIDGDPPQGFPHTSTVVSFNPTCPAYWQDNKCGDCRRCWDGRVKNVSYRYH